MSIHQRMSDAEARKKLSAFREKRKRIELEASYSDVFKDCEAEGDQDIEIYPGEAFTYGFDNDGSSTLESREFEVDKDMEVDYDLDYGGFDGPSVFDDDDPVRNISDIISPRMTYIEDNNSLTNLDGNSNRRIPDIGPPRIPDIEPEDNFVPFWANSWFKYGVPTALGVTASLLEIWRALS